MGGKVRGEVSSNSGMSTRGSSLGEYLLLPSAQPGAGYGGMNMEILHDHNIGGRLLPGMGVAVEGFQGGLAFEGKCPFLHILLLLAGVGIPLAGTWFIFFLGGGIQGNGIRRAVLQIIRGHFLGGRGFSSLGPPAPWTWFLAG